jgi:hypothetical protein
MIFACYLGFFGAIRFLADPKILHRFVDLSHSHHYFRVLAALTLLSAYLGMMIFVIYSLSRPKLKEQFNPRDKG